MFQSIMKFYYVIHESEFDRRTIPRRHPITVLALMRCAGNTDEQLKDDTLEFDSKSIKLVYIISNI